MLMEGGEYKIQSFYDHTPMHARTHCEYRILGVGPTMNVNCVRL